MQEGKVIFFNQTKGWGFIKGATEDYFIHYTCIAGSGYRNLNQDDIVSFEVGEHNGRPRAENVTVISHAQPEPQDPQEQKIEKAVY